MKKSNPMILTVGGIKGGSGKTTISTNLAVMFSQSGKDVLFVDADDQGTATDFSHWRNETMNGEMGYTAIQLKGAAVRTETQKLAQKYDVVIIDTGGRDTTSQRAALVVSNILLVPFIPRSFDIWTIEKVTRLVKEAKIYNPELNACAFINRADARGSHNDDAKNLIIDETVFTFIDAPIGNRNAVSLASSRGLGVIEYKPKDSKAIGEMEQLFKKIQSL